MSDQGKSSTYSLDERALIDVGDGPTTVVLLHGWCCRTGHFSSVIDKMSDRFRVLAIDWQDRMRAKGIDHSCDAIAEDLADVLEERGVTDPIFCGHSFGAGMPMILEANGRVSPKGLVILEHSLLLGDQARKALLGWKSLLTPENVKNFYATIGRAHFFLKDEHGIESDEIVRGMLEVPVEEARSLLTQFCSIDWKPIMKGTQAQVHYVASAMSIAACRSLLAPFMPSCRFGHLDCGHFMPVFRPEKVVRIIEEILDPTIDSRE